MTVHPRVYGEYNKQPEMSGIILGSSPRVRGILECCAAQILDKRFIPACTGNTVLDWELPINYPVHPRVYGEYEPRLNPSSSTAGSSPRVRGIQ